MDTESLVHMANRIGEFFEAMPDREEASEGITQHLRRYWDPRMRRELMDHVQQRQGEGLMPLVLDALKTVRGSLA